jgi:hypothetical protein
MHDGNVSAGAVPGIDFLGANIAGCQEEEIPQ